MINVSVYFLIFLSLGNYLNFSVLLIFTPFIELLGQFTFIIFGIKEISTIFVLDFIDVEKELALAGALIYLFVEFIVVITLYSVLNINKINIFKNK